MRISDWSSDVCSSDLAAHVVHHQRGGGGGVVGRLPGRVVDHQADRGGALELLLDEARGATVGLGPGQFAGGRGDLVQVQRRVLETGQQLVEALARAFVRLEVVDQVPAGPVRYEETKFALQST